MQYQIYILAALVAFASTSAFAQPQLHDAAKRSSFMTKLSHSHSFRQRVLLAVAPFTHTGVMNTPLQSVSSELHHFHSSGWKHPMSEGAQLNFDFARAKSQSFSRRSRMKLSQYAIPEQVKPKAGTERVSSGVKTTVSSKVFNTQNILPTKFNVAANPRAREIPSPASGALPHSLPNNNRPKQTTHADVVERRQVPIINREKPSQLLKTPTKIQVEKAVVAKHSVQTAIDPQLPSVNNALEDYIKAAREKLPKKYKWYDIRKYIVGPPLPQLKAEYTKLQTDWPPAFRQAYKHALEEARDEKRLSDVAFQQNFDKIQGIEASAVALEEAIVSENKGAHILNELKKESPSTWGLKDKSLVQFEDGILGKSVRWIKGAKAITLAEKLEKLYKSNVEKLQTIDAVIPALKEERRRAFRNAELGRWTLTEDRLRELSSRKQSLLRRQTHVRQEYILAQPERPFDEAVSTLQKYETFWPETPVEVIRYMLNVVGRELHVRGEVNFLDDIN